MTGKRGPFSDFSEGSAEGRRYSTDSDSKSGMRFVWLKPNPEQKSQDVFQRSLFHVKMHHFSLDVIPELCMLLCFLSIFV